MIELIKQNLILDKNSSEPMYQQLGAVICMLAESGLIKPKDKLPPIRKLAEALDINNITVVNAYKYLENKKIV